MHWQYTPYVLPLLVAAAISAALALFAWQRRPAPGATSFALLMVAVAEWSLGHALELGSTDLLTKGFWTKIEFLGITVVPVTWLAFALQHTGWEKWLTTRNLVLLAIEPLVMLLLHWTNEVHSLIARDVRLDTSGSLPVLDFTYGAGLWVHTVYSYLLLLLGTFLLLQALIRSPRLYRGQAGTVLIAALAPWVGNVIYISGLSPFPYLDLTPFAFTITGLAVAWGLFRFRLLDIVPVARDTVIEGMSDGVIVLDTQNRIVDLNLAAQRATSRPASEAIGQPAAQVFSAWPDLVERYRDVTEVHEEFVLGEGEAQRCFDLRISPLYDRGGRFTGRLVVLRDITKRKQAEEALRRAEAETRRHLKEQIALREAGTIIASTLDLAEVLARIAEQMGLAIDVTSAYITRHEPETMTCTVVAEYTCPEACAWERVSDLGVTYHYTEDDIEFLKAMETGRPDISQLDDPDLPEFERAHMQEYGAQMILYIPLRVREQLIGYAELWESRQQREFTPEEITLCQGIAQQAAIAIENARLFEEAQRELAERKRVEEELQRTTENLRKALGATIQAIALTVEAKDPYTAGHQRRVADLARAIATEMGLSKEQIDGIRMAGVIHDIGKISVPGEILSKPARLSDIEFGLIKTHPQVGYDILKTIDFPWPVAQIVLQHHERMNGSGYPHGLSGEEIILEARILAVADAVEAMASYRPYRPAHSAEEALEEISQNRGVLYDPEVVDACLRLFIEKGFKVQSSMEDYNGDGTCNRSG